MEDFQYFVISDQLHKERLALKGAELVPEEKVLIIYDRAVFDDKAYISDEQFVKTIAHFGLTEEELLGHYDAVLHLVTCAKGAEFAYNFGNAARYESVEVAREKDDLTLRAWSSHPRLYIIDNSVDFEDKINRGIAQIYRIIGESVPEQKKRKYLISRPDTDTLINALKASKTPMMQSYLVSQNPKIERRIRKQRSGKEHLYFYTEKRIGEDGTRWVTERPISKKEYEAYLMERDPNLHQVRKIKYRFTTGGSRAEIDIYPFSEDKAVLFVYGQGLPEIQLPEGIRILKDVTGDAEYKNKKLAETQRL